MLRGLTTVTFFADDLTAAQRWYTEVLGIEPYLSRSVDGTPAYIEFRIGDYQHELGFIDSRFAPHGRSGKAGGAVTYCAVDDVQAGFERLLSLGATVHEKPVGRGPGYVTASVVDPREHPRRDVQPALPGGSRVTGQGLTELLVVSSTATQRRLEPQVHVVASSRITRVTLG
jgi:catechol 2,3-dioxygenase-like lactoylglutathione lyase family enzyme